MEFEINEINIDHEFERLSKLLLLEKVLVVNNEKIRFTEIEFYYYSKNHDDAFTHEHGSDAGKWRFHNQGFDITLKGESGFGGILIRGIEIGGKYFNGPRRVLFEIMSHLNPVNQIDNKFGLVNNEIKLDLPIFRTFRHGLNTPNSNLTCKNPAYFIGTNYRFLVDPQKFDKKQFSGAEKIAVGFKNSEQSFKFLGYLKS